MAEETLDLVDLNSYLTTSIKDECRAFDCEVTEINDYLKDFASRKYYNQKSRVILAVKDNTIVGYVSFSISDIRVDQTKFSDDDTKEAFPVLKIDALGVDKNFKGNSYGAKLIVYVLRSAVSMKLFVTFSGVYLNALIEKVDYYESFGFEFLDGDENRKYNYGVNNGKTIKMILNMITLSGIGIQPFEFYNYDTERVD